MSVSEEEVLRRLSGVLQERGYSREDHETFRRGLDASFALIHLAVRDDSMMPRLSIGLAPISRTGTVLSTDLHVLVAPDTRFRYRFTPEDVDRMERDLIEQGVPWLERHLDLEELTRALEEQLAARKPQQQKSRWWSTTTLSTSASSTNPLALRTLSHCYELQSRYDKALERWQQYVATKDLGPSGEHLERLRILEMKARETRA